MSIRNRGGGPCAKEVANVTVVTKGKAALVEVPLGDGAPPAVPEGNRDLQVCKEINATARHIFFTPGGFVTRPVSAGSSAWPRTGANADLAPRRLNSRSHVCASLPQAAFKDYQKKRLEVRREARRREAAAVRRCRLNTASA